LRRIDPVAAALIHPHDLKRIVRALEVFVCTGRPISELQKERRGLGKGYDIAIFCLTMPRDQLIRKIDARVERMFHKGLLSEVRKLRRQSLSRTASYAIGIRELQGYLDGRYPLHEAKRLIKRNTQSYAKRQMTWFRKDKRIQWIEIGQHERPSQVAARIEVLWKKRS
jgi:tRNA dimethylallyltransferase